MRSEECEPVNPATYIKVTNEEIDELVATMRDHYSIELTREEARRYMSWVPTPEEIEEEMEGA